MCQWRRLSRAPTRSASAPDMAVLRDWSTSHRHSSAFVKKPLVVSGGTLRYSSSTPNARYTGANVAGGRAISRSSPRLGTATGPRVVNAVLE